MRELDLKDDQKAIVVYSDEDRIAGIKRGYFPIYQKILRLGKNLNYDIHYFSASLKKRPNATIQEKLEHVKYNPKHLHLVFKHTPKSQKNIFHSIPGYLKGYWFFGPHGVRNAAGLKYDLFDPRKINPERASDFFDSIYDQFVLTNSSKYAQSELEEERIEPGSIVYFMQGDVLDYGIKHYIKTKPLLEKLIQQRGDRKVYIKPHPKQIYAQIEGYYQQFHDPENGVEFTMKSVHELINDCALLMCQSSAVALEACMHQKPAIVAGEVDYVHNVVTIKNVDEVAGAIDEALKRKFYYKEYLFWYLHLNCLRENGSDIKKAIKKSPMRTWNLDMKHCNL